MATSEHIHPARRPDFDDDTTAWRSARRAAMEHILTVVAGSRWSEHLVLRGSILLRAWFGDAAREPGDLDWVVTPPTMMLEDRRTARMLDGLAAAIRAQPRVSDTVMLGRDVKMDDVWTYERAPVRRLMVDWSTTDTTGGPVTPYGTIQLDFAFNEVLPVPAARTHILRGDGSEPVTVWAAGPALSLAWKILWLETDFTPQGKNLYDATLLAERTYLPLDLLREVLSRELGAEAEAFTADRVLGWSVDWQTFADEHPWVPGKGTQWQVRLHRALQGTFGDGSRS